MSRFCFCLSVFIWTAATAEMTDFAFQSDQQEQRFIELAKELRCLVCQNQSLADSNAGLADDLRSELYRQVLNEHSDDQIIAFMTERYGEFILYRPRFNAGTLLLWTAPLLLLVAAGLSLFLFSRRREPLAEGGVMEPEAGKIRDLLENKIGKK